MMAVSMTSGQNVEQFGVALKSRVAELEKLLPAGFELSYVTFQADVVKREMGKMNQVMIETIVIVLGVVVALAAYFLEIWIDNNFARVTALASGGFGRIPQTLARKARYRLCVASTCTSLPAKCSASLDDLALVKALWCG